MAKVELDLIANVKEATKNFDRFAKDAGSSLTNIEKSFSGLKTAAFAVGGAFAAAFAGRALINAIDAVVAASSRQEDAVNSLNSALKISGKFSEEASKGIQEFASELQVASKFGDEVILENAALIQSLGGLEEDGLKKATKAAVDMAAALKIDLTSAATLVGKAAAGEIGSFSRYGVVIKKGADNAETFANALEALNSKFGGAAKDQINTYAGATSRLSNTYGDLLEILGDAITKNPAVIASINAINDAFKASDGSVKSFSETIKSFIDTMIELAASVIPVLGRGFILLLEQIQKITKAVNTFKQVGANLRLIKEFLTFGDVESAVKDVQKLNEEFGKTVFEQGSLNNKLEDGIKFLEETRDRIISAKDEAKKSADIAQDANNARKEAVKLTDEQIAKQKELAQKQLDELKKIQSENAKIALDVKNAGQSEEIIRKNNLEYQLQLIDAKKLELQAQGLLTDELSKQIDLQKELITQASSAKATPAIDPAKQVAVEDTAIIKSGTVQAIKAGLGETAGSIASSVAGFINPAGAIIEGVKAVVGVVQGLINFIPDILNSIGGIFESITNLPLTIVEAFGKVFSSLTGLARNLLKNLVEGLGGLIADAFTFVLQDLPQALADALNELPTIVANILDKLPDLIINLANNLGPIITSLVEGLVEASPRIMVSLIDAFITKGGAVKISLALAKAMAIDVPQAIIRGLANGFRTLAGEAAVSMGRAFSNNIKLPKLTVPIPTWLGEFKSALSGGKFIELMQKIVDFLQDIADKINKALGQGGGGVFGQLTKGNIGGATSDLLGGSKRKSIIGFAEGGLVPSGFPNDTFPARLTSGELVIDKTTVDKLNSFMDRESEPRTSVIKLVVGEKELANVIYGLNKRGFRTA